MDRRSKKLDQYLNKNVKITFFNGNVIIGFLGWNEYYDKLMITPKRYYLKCPDGVYTTFWETCVKSIKEVIKGD